MSDFRRIKVKDAFSSEEKYQAWRSAATAQAAKNNVLRTERYLMNIISRLDELHLKGLTEEETKAVEVLKRYLQKQERDLDSAHRLKVSSSEFIVVCPHCESQDVHVQTVPDEFDDEEVWKIEVECRKCELKGYLDSY
jgi:hypothetical protein